ncbi:MAG: ferritin family protein [Patescibacteria group bacterium]
MMSKTPIDLKGVKEGETDMQLLRIALIAELDAINFYEQCAASTKDTAMKKIFLDVAGEEKTHIGEFQSLLLIRDREQEKELIHGDKEVDDLTGEGSEEED